MKESATEELKRALELRHQFPKAAEAHASKAVRLSWNQPHLQAEALRVLAGCFRRRGQWADAKVALIVGWEMIAPTASVEERAKYAESLSYLFVATKNLADAAGLASEKIRLLAPLGGEVLFAAWHELGNIFADPAWEGQNIPTARSIAESVLERVDRSSSMFGISLSLLIYARTQDDSDSGAGMQQELSLLSQLVPRQKGSLRDAEFHWIEGLVFRKFDEYQRSRAHFMRARDLFATHDNHSKLVVASLDQVILEKRHGETMRSSQVCGELFPIIGRFEGERYLVLTELKRAFAEGIATCQLVRNIRRRFEALS